MLVLAVALALGAAPVQAPPREKSAPEPPLPTVQARFHHDLTTPTGPPELTWPSLTYDRARDEVFVVAEGFVRVFDVSGMEVHRFGDDGSLGDVTRVAVLDDGEILALSRIKGKRAIFRCDFRGELIARFAITGLPEPLSGFEPDELVHRNGRLYFAERSRARVVMTDVQGAYRQAFNVTDLVAAVIQEGSDTKAAAFMDSFGVDASGNLLFTSSTMFAAGVVSPAGDVRLFGGRGSRPGRFNIIGGIDADEDGNLFVSDRLRSVISVWDRELRFLGEFGYRGDGPSNLLAPYEIAVGNGKVFASQAADRGVKVFRVKLVERKAPPPAPVRARPAPAQPRREPPQREPPGPRRIG